MGNWTIQGHNRGGGQRKSHYVRPYQQNRKDGKPNGGYVKKGYTACQTTIAEVYNRNLAYNATQKVIRENSMWRHYICECQSSHLYAIATTGTAPASNWFGDDPRVGESYTYTDKNGRKRTIEGLMINKQGGQYTSSCIPVSVFVPPYRKPLTGKQRLRLRLG